jgi:hypothetical protein
MLLSKALCKNGGSVGAHRTEQRLDLLQGLRPDAIRIGGAVWKQDHQAVHRHPAVCQLQCRELIRHCRTRPLAKYGQQTDVAAKADEVYKQCQYRFTYRTWRRQ